MHFVPSSSIQVDSQVRADNLAPVVSGLLALFAIARMNAILYRETHSDEALHQFRVSLRRVRSILTFNKTLIGQPYLTLNQRLQTILSGSGDCRDLDVLINKLDTLDVAETNAQAHFRLWLTEQRARTRQHLIARLTPMTLEPLFHHMTDILLRHVAKLKHRDYSAWVCRRYQKKHRQLRQRLQKIGSLNAEQLHRLRIRAKLLRYSGEFYQVWLTSSTQNAWKQWQTKLGELNDLHVQLTILTAYQQQLSNGSAHQAAAQALHAILQAEWEEVLHSLRQV